MNTTDKIRLANLLLLLRECEKELGKKRGAAALLSRRSGVPSPMISQIVSGAKNTKGKGARRKIGDDTARKLESGMNKVEGWMDQDHGAAKSVNEAHFLDLIRLLTASQRERLAGLAEEYAELNAAATNGHGPINVESDRGKRKH